MIDDKSAEDNARIFGILSLVFFFIPIIGLVLGIIATQKGRNGKSSFAVTTGWIGIAIAVLMMIFFGLIGYKATQNNSQEVNTQAQDKEARYQECIRDRLADFSTQGVYSVAEAQCDWARP